MGPKASPRSCIPNVLRETITAAIAASYLGAAIYERDCGRTPVSDEEFGPNIAHTLKSSTLVAARLTARPNARPRLRRETEPYLR